MSGLINIPYEVQKLYDNLKSEFPSEELLLRPTTSLIYKDEKRWEIALVRGDYEALLTMGSTFVYSDVRVAVEELELVFSRRAQRNDSQERDNV